MKCFNKRGFMPVRRGTEAPVVYLDEPNMGRSYENYVFNHNYKNKELILRVGKWKHYLYSGSS